MMTTRVGTDIATAASLLKQGNLVAIPTETVYGLAANALNEDAVLKIYQVKQRPQFNPLIVHVASFEQALQYIKRIPFNAQSLVEACWPGPLTLLFEKKSIIPDLVTAGSNLVALRIPDHLLTLELLKLVGIPVAAPSANPSGYVSPTAAEHVYKSLQNKIPYILDGGECRVGVESTILGWNENDEPEVYRLGGIAIETIEEVLNQKVKIKKQFTNNPDSPGQLKSHYATHTPLYMGHTAELLSRFENHKMILINFTDYHPDIPGENQFILSASGSLEEAAKNLFKILRCADELKADVILAEPLPHKGLGMAINDRLERAQYMNKK